MRHTARMAVLKLDVSDKLRRAMTRGPPDNRSHEHEYLPGGRIYFWAPAPSKGRHRRDPGRWRGPALTIIREKHQRYFVSWHGRLLLLAAENMRPAPAAESTTFDLIHAEAEDFEKEWKEKGEADFEYEDKTIDEAPPEELENHDSNVLQGLKSVRKFFLKDKLRDKRQRALPPPPALGAEVADQESNYEPTENGSDKDWLA